MARGRRLEFDITGDSRDLQRAFRGADQSAGKFGDRMSKVNQALKVAGAAAAGAAVVGLKKAAEAAIDSEAAMAKVRSMVENTGHSWATYGEQIDAAIQKQSQMTGIDDEELAASFANLLRTTGDVNKALELNALAADVSRSKGMELAGAQSLLARVYNGAYAGLKRLGIAIEPVTAAQDALKSGTDRATDAQVKAAKQADSVATRQKALAELQKQFGGQAEAYGATTAGSIDKANVAWENILETVGTAVAPAIQDAADALTKFIGEMESGTGAGGEFAETAGDVADVLGDVVGFLKENPALVATAVGAWGTYKAAVMTATAISNFKALRASFRRTVPIAGAEGAAAGRAYATGFNTSSTTGVAAGKGRFGKVGASFGLAFGAAAATAASDQILKGLDKLTSGSDFAEIVARTVLPFGWSAPGVVKKITKPARPNVAAGPPRPSPGANRHPDNARTSSLPGQGGTARRNPRPSSGGASRQPGEGRSPNRPVGSTGGGRVTGDTAGLNPDFLKRLQAMSAGTGHAITVRSGRRTSQEQAALVESKGVYHPTRNPQGAAPVGSSNHETGRAADISPGRETFGSVAADYGIAFPVPGEPWHAEPVGAVAGTPAAVAGPGGSSVSIGGGMSVSAGPTPAQRRAKRQDSAHRSRQTRRRDQHLDVARSDALRDRGPTYAQREADAELQVATADTTEGVDHGEVDARQALRDLHAKRAAWLRKRIKWLKAQLDKTGLPLKRRRKFMRELDDRVGELVMLTGTIRGEDAEIAGMLDEGASGDGYYTTGTPEFEEPGGGGGGGGAAPGVDSGAQRDALLAQLVANQNTIIRLAQQQGPQIMAALAALVSGDIGGKVGLGTQTPGFAGGVARY